MSKPQSIMEMIEAQTAHEVRLARNAALEEAAHAAELRMVFGGEPPTPHHRQVVEHIAAAIRQLKTA